MKIWLHQGILFPLYIRLLFIPLAVACQLQKLWLSLKWAPNKKSPALVPWPEIVLHLSDTYRGNIFIRSLENGIQFISWYYSLYITWKIIKIHISLWGPMGKIFYPWSEYHKHDWAEVLKMSRGMFYTRGWSRIHCQRRWWNQNTFTMFLRHLGRHLNGQGH